jgi:hypothetical protein
VSWFDRRWAKGVRTDLEPTVAADSRFTRTDAAREAGMSDRQVSQLNRGAEGPSVPIGTEVEFGRSRARIALLCCHCTGWRFSRFL